MAGTDTAAADAATGSLNDAAQAFAGMFAAEAGPSSPQRPSAESDAVPSQEQALEADDGVETAELDDSSDAPEEAQSADADDQEGDEQETQYFTVKIDGKEEQVSLDEALKGYQRQADYSRKTSELAAERKEFQVQLEAVTTERAQYAQLLGALSEQLQAAAPAEPDWQRLYEENPLEYVRMKDLFNERQQKLQAAQYEMQRIQQLAYQEQQQQSAKDVEFSRQRLLEMHPDWKDRQTWADTRAKMVEYGQTRGYSVEDLNASKDFRAIDILWRAMKYDEIRSRQERQRPTPQRGPRTMAAGSSATAPRPNSEITKAHQRLAQSGSVADAAALFSKLL